MIEHASHLPVKMEIFSRKYSSSVVSLDFCVDSLPFWAMLISNYPNRLTCFTDFLIFSLLGFPRGLPCVDGFARKFVARAIQIRPWPVFMTSGLI
jgi:hypothetical protein